MENEKIFVVVPVYKVEAYLDRCIGSILNQTYSNWELILVDDGSPDNCPSICDRYAAEHENITVIHQENGGLSAARNAGIDYALKTGDSEQNWINFIDSDDFIHPKYLECLHRAAAEAGTDISSCGNLRTEKTVISVDENVLLKYDILSPEDYWCWNNIIAGLAWGKLYKLYLFDKIQYPVGKIYEDGFTTYRILFLQTSIAVIWDKLYYWYVRPDSITSAPWTPAQIDAIDALDDQLSYFRENGYQKAYAPTVKFLFWHSLKQLIKVRALSPEYDSYIPEMKARWKRASKLHTEEFGLINSVAYWFKIRIKDPAKRILEKETVFSFLKRRIKKILCLG